PPPPPPPKSEEEVKREAAAKRAAERKAQREAKELAAKTPPATLLSVVQMGNERSVVLDIKGNVATVKDGANSPVGPVHVLSGNSATVNGWTLKVHEQTLGRFVTSDKAAAPSFPSGAASASQFAGSNGLPPPIPAPNPVAADPSAPYPIP